MDKANILIVEDDPLQRRLIKENLEQEDYAVFEASNGKEASNIIALHSIDIAVVDYKLDGETGINVIQEILEQNPLVTSIVVTAYGNIENAVDAIKKGAYDYIVKPIDFDKFLLAIERALERQKLKKEISSLKSSLEEKFSSKNFIFTSSKMEEVTILVSKASKSDATVIISGETGTGKDFVAKTIHFSSKRKKGPYLAVNIPALPETLIESELFGAEKGAFTGAYERKIGKFEAVSGGTLLLDEIGDLPLQMQVKLLRFLQEKEFFRLGSSQPLKSDVRIIAATNKDLEKLVKEAKFRPDLYYRLNVISILVPPLRKRKEDIPPLVDYFIRKYSKKEGKDIEGISAEGMNLLLNYLFPGNIRELENIIERAAVFCDRNFITSADLPIFLKDKKEKELIEEGLSLKDRVKQLEIKEIKKALLESGKVKSKAARYLGITERILSYKMKVYNLSSD
ncbi:MAG: sigma-54-dependent Fis family transcriptional regulator [Candidatus Aminicenantes bacterium]|nr:sigma-54-dependent Fis family transcriptional regulator [Candidatus Aminicenantes bacterium]MBL7082473.1 sigma-54-dependent Fis family transcriptional regulator [Candidatus Aminicenantes bacterium]